MYRALAGLWGLLVVSGCDYQGGYGPPGAELDPPEHLTYEVEPSGTPGEPTGIVLRWDNDPDPEIRAWNVYGRDDTQGSWTLVGTTSSNSFHENGQPRLQYEVTAVGFEDQESPPSNVVTIDERLALSKPASLTSVTLNAAIALLWSDNSYTDDPEGFAHYRVYSTTYDIDADQCGAQWRLEGTTVAPEFRVGAMVNGVSRCFGVSAISIEGFESLWSPLRADTPRPDARNVTVTSRQTTDATAGFRFWRDQNGDGRTQSNELGRIGPGGSPDADFALERDPSGRLFLAPVRTGTTVVRYGAGPVAELSSIDVAPVSGYSRTPIEALPGWGFVFQMDGGDQFFRYGALRVSHVGRDLIIFDWAFQTDPGNPELVVARSGSLRLIARPQSGRGNPPAGGQEIVSLRSR